MSKNNPLALPRLAGLAAALVIPTATGCLQIDLVQTMVDPSSAIALTIEARGNAGTPRPDLTAEDFEILEDGSLLAPSETQQALVYDEGLFAPITVVMVDISGSVQEGNTLSHVQDAIRLYAAGVMGEQNDSGTQMAVYTFDGSAEPQQLVAFTTDYDELQNGIDQLTTACTQQDCDPSRNLHGAIVSGLDILDARTCASDRLGIGSFVLFTNGPDQAARVERRAATQRSRDTQHQVYTIGLGSAVETSFLQRISTHGAEKVSEAGDLSEAFVQTADTVSGMFQSTYALVYCSPKRSGIHDVKVRASQAGARGTTTFEIDAGSFDPTPDCRPADWLDGTLLAPTLAGASCDGSGSD